MNKIDELINRFCPNGVEFKKIEDLCNITRGKVMSKDFIRNNMGDYPVYSSQTDNNGELGKISTYEFDGEYLTWTTDGANAGSVFYRNGKFSVTNVCGLLKVKNNIINTKFLYYILSIEAPKYVNAGMGNPKLMSNVMARIRVAVPPMEVQNEIVRILDDFTLLSAELSAELKARKKQYQYYLDYFYNINNIDNLNGKIYLLEELGDIIRGKRFVHADAVLKDGIPAIHYGEIYTYYGISATQTKSQIRKDIPKKLRYARKGDVVIVGAGENNIDIGIGVSWEGNYEVAIHDACYIFHPNEKILSKYLSFYLRSSFYHNQIKKYVSEGKICAISAQGLGKAKIFLPTIREQERIINILEKFDKLNRDIVEGIPAEIEARQKQYEYYRDKLLTFKELKVEK